MPNPFYNAPNGQFNNPNTNLSQLVNNPMFQMMKNKGMNTEQIVRYLCQQKGIDVNQLLQQAQQLKSNNR